MESLHIISQEITLLEALARINTFKVPEPLVLFVVDNQQRMVGTLTDGDSRRALIAGASVSDKAEKVMHRQFLYMRQEDVTNVKEIRHQKEMKMQLVPILDEEHHIVDIINLEKYKTRLPVDAVIMAGGKGERLRPLTQKTPKPLLPVGNKAIIDYNVDRLISYGITNISVTTNYLAEQLEDHFSEPYGDIKVHCVREPKFLGTIGSVLYVKEFHNDTVLVMNSDIFTNIDYEDFYLHFLQYDAEMSVAAIPYNVAIPYGIFQLEGRNIKGLIEKPKYNYYANAGIYLIKRRALSEIPHDTMFHSTDLIEKLIAEGKTVIRYPLNGTWIDIGTPQEYQKANDYVNHL